MGGWQQKMQQQGLEILVCRPQGRRQKVPSCRGSRQRSSEEAGEGAERAPWMG